MTPLAIANVYDPEILARSAVGRVVKLFVVVRREYPAYVVAGGPVFVAKQGALVVVGEVHPGGEAPVVGILGIQIAERKSPIAWDDESPGIVVEPGG